MDTYPKVPEGILARADTSTTHKYAAPGVPKDHAREALQIGLNLQTVAVDLDSRHSQEFRHTRQINRMRHIAWFLVVLAAILVTIAVAPLDSWWHSIQDMAVEDAPAGR